MRRDRTGCGGLPLAWVTGGLLSTLGLISVAGAQRLAERGGAKVRPRAGTVASGRARVAPRVAPRQLPVGPGRQLTPQQKRARALRAIDHRQSKLNLGIIARIKRMLPKLKRQRQLPLRVRYLQRMAGLQKQEADYRYGLALQRYERQVELFQNGKLSAQPAQPRRDYRPAIASLTRAVTLIPRCYRCDEVYYRLGGLYQQQRKTRAALAALTRLQQLFPKSPRLGASQLMMGELWFDAGQFNNALASYRAALRSRGSGTASDYARYKSAWCRYRLGQPAAAVTALEALAGRPGSALRSQALGDLVRFYAALPQGWPRAVGFYRKRVGRASLLYLWRLTQFYAAQGQNTRALAGLGWLQRQDGRSAQTTAYHQLEVDILVRLGVAARLKIGLERIVRFYRSGSPWNRALSGQPGARRAGAALAEKALAYVATTFHRQGQQSGQTALLKQALGLYQRFLKRFPRSPQASRMRFYLADLLKGFVRYGDAAAQFALVASDPAYPQREEAAYLRVWCLGKILGPPQPRTTGALAVLSPLQRRFVTAADDYALHFPESKAAAKVTFSTAQLFQAQGYLARAAKRFGAIARGQPNSHLGGLAGALALRSARELKNWDRLARWSRWLIKRRHVGTYSVVALRGFIVGAGIQAAEALAKSGSNIAAAQRACATFRELPKHQDAPRALFNCAVYRERARQFERAVARYRQLRKLAPRSSFAARATFVLGMLRERRADFAGAARYYSQLANMAPIARTPDAIHNAAVLFEALGSHRRAIGLRELFWKRWPGRADAVGTFAGIGKVLEGQKRWREAERFYRDLLRRQALLRKDPGLAVVAWTRAGRALRKGVLPTLRSATARKRTARLAARHFKRALASYGRLKSGRTKRSTNHAAWAAFQLGELTFAQCRAQVLRAGKIATLVRAIMTKAKCIERARQRYTKALAYRAVVWVTAAVYRIGSIYEHVTTEIRRLPCPFKAGSVACSNYRIELEKLVQLIEEKALAGYRKAVAVAHRLRTYNRFTARAAQRLLTLDPEAYPNPGRRVLRGGHQGRLRVTRPTPSLHSLR